MTQASPEKNGSSREDTLFKNIQADFHQMISEDEEQKIFLERQAAHLALSVGVSDNHDVKVREVERFLKNAEYSEPQAPTVALLKQDFVHSIIDKLEGKTKTETAAALKAQNDALRQQIDDIKAMLQMQLSDKDLLAVTPFLKLPDTIEIDVEEFASEVQDALITTHEQELAIPSTAELETSLENVTDDTVSPARGIALLGHWTVDIFKRSR